MRQTDWHLRSWNDFLDNGLAKLLAERLPLNAYRIKRTGETAIIAIGVQGEDGRTIPAAYPGIPLPDATGVFFYKSNETVVVPHVPDERLESVQCCGDLALSYLNFRIASAPKGFFIDGDSVESWLPLADWIDGFFAEHGQILDSTNSISRDTHLNRILVDKVNDVGPLSQIGFTCPVETPEGPNIGRVLTVAQGARISGSEIVRAESDPVMALGTSAMMIPFLEHCDPARLLMGANMQRQWQVPEESERALVQTGMEPDDDQFWCGYNLFTIFASAGVLNCEDGLVLSETAALKFKYRYPIEIGDKLSSRQGYKGVVAAILPDDEMPKLPDGTCADIIQSFSGLHTRMNTGQLFEAIAGRIAKVSGQPFIARPFASPSRKRLKELLIQNGLSEDGMDYLDFGNGCEPAYSTLSGWVYWGRTHHDVRRKIHFFTKKEERPAQRIGAMEYYAYRNVGAYRLLQEQITVCSHDSPVAALLSDAISQGSPIPRDVPSMPFNRLVKILSLAGISAEVIKSGVQFSIDTSGSYQLSIPIAHPWNGSWRIDRLESGDGHAGWSEVHAENQRLNELIESGAPEALKNAASLNLSKHLTTYFSQLFNYTDCLATGRALFSGRSVIVPTARLRSEQIGVPEEMAWGLFGPMASAKVGEAEVAERTEAAIAALDGVMAASWIVMNRAPTMTETALIAFKPVRVGHNAIELNPLVCKWINGDFDGDQVALFLPLTNETQQEVAEKLSVIGHLKRDPSLIASLVPPHEAVWGISHAFLSDKGRKEISAVIGHEIRTVERHLRQDELMHAVGTVLLHDGAEKAVKVLEELMDLGFNTAAVSGASMNLFFAIPGDKDPANRSRQEVKEVFEACNEYDSGVFGVQLLLVKSNIRGDSENLTSLTHSSSNGIGGLLSGMEPDPFFRQAMEMRERLAKFVLQIQSLDDFHDERMSRAYSVLARAVRCDNPGVVFASAAMAGEVDPLTDVDARLFVGLLPYGEE